MGDCIKERKYKAVFSDIDGTLLNTSHQIPGLTRKKIYSINQQGIAFVLVSARMPKGMTGIRRELRIESPMICYSGALIVDEKNQPMYSAPLEKEDAYRLCHMIRKIDSEISINLYSNDLWMAEDNKEFWVKQEMEITGVQAKEVSFETASAFEEVHKILCMGQADRIADLEERLKEQFPKIRIYRSKDTYLEIMSMEASKSDAVGRLEGKFGVTREEIIAFGDNHNDIDMIQYAGLGVAMGNAAKEVQKIADYVTDTNDREGLLKVLEKYFC